MKFGKQVLALILSAVMLISCASLAFAEDIPTSGKLGNLFWNYDKASKTLTIGGNGDMPKREWSGYGEFSDEIETIVVQQGVVSLENASFGYMENLKKVSLPSTVSTTGCYCGCTSLVEINLPDSIKEISSNAFVSCSSLKSISIPSSVVSIGYRAFSGCPISEITIPDSVLSCGEEVFKECESLKRITLPKGIKKIPAYMFAGCKNLQSISIPDSVTEVGGAAFENCVSLSSVSFPNSLKSIGRNAFEGCSSLSSVSFPNSLESIGGSTFEGCQKLSNISISDRTIDIGTDAFEGTAWEARQPDGAQYIGKVFYKYKGEIPSNVFFSMKEGTLAIAGSAFKNQKNLSEITLPDGLIIIGNSAFYSCQKLSSVLLPDSVISIGSSAFAECESLKEIVVHKNDSKLQSVGSNAFYGDFAFLGMNFPDSLIYIGYNAFAWTKWENRLSDGLVYCGSVLYQYKGDMPAGTSISIKEGTVCIRASAFSECKTLTKVTMPASLKVIEGSAFFHCDALSSVSFSEGLEKIEAYAFSCCGSLSALILPDSTSEIGRGAFDGCTSLKTISIGLAKCDFDYDRSSFAENSKLTAIMVNENNKYYSLDENGVLFNKEKTELIRYPAGKSDETYHIPEGVKTVKTGAFAGCDQLKNIYFPLSIQILEADSFSKDSKKYGAFEIYYPDSRDNYWDRIDADCSFEYSTESHLHTVEPEVPSTDPVTQPSTDPVTQPSTDPVTNPSQEPTGEEPALPDSDHVHNRTVEKIAATFDEDGEEKICCEECGYTYSYRTIPAIASVKLSTSKYGYDGKQKQPKVVVRDREGNELEEGKDYTVKYSSGRKKIGKYNVRVTFQNDYKGTKKLSFRIIPGKVRGLKATAGKKFAKLKWNAVKGATNYVVYFATKKNGTFKKAFTTRGATAKVMKLKSGKTYYFRVRAIAKLDSGTFNGNLSAIQKAKIK